VSDETNRVVLEPAAQAFADANAAAPFLFELGPEGGRRVLDEVQSGDVAKPDVEIEELRIGGGPSGEVALRLLRPPGAKGTLPVILFLHGAGWVFGSPVTHDRLARELAVGAGAALVFVDYRRSPEARYPSAIEEAFATMQWIASEGSSRGLDPARLAVAGDSVGGNMSAALTLLTKQRSGPALVGQVLFYPVTDATFDTGSYHAFSEGYHLRRDAMMWFWDQYATGDEERAQNTASPLRATEEDLAGLPRALVITAEADVLRDEGEAYAAKLRAAGVDVASTRYGGAIHDFVMVDAMRDTRAARDATAQAIRFLAEVLS